MREKLFMNLLWLKNWFCLKEVITLKHIKRLACFIYQIRKIYIIYKITIMHPELLQNTYRYADYLVVIHPHDDLRQKIMTIKKEFAEKYNAVTGGRPHIM